MPYCIYPFKYGDTHWNIQYSSKFIVENCSLYLLYNFTVLVKVGTFCWWAMGVGDYTCVHTGTLITTSTF